jgi:hypothetical protein
MVTNHRSLLIAMMLFGSSAARAQAVECKKTETQAECHTRLKCKADEELEDCLKRLRAAGQQQQGNNGGNNGGANDQRGGGGDRGDRGGGGGDDRAQDRGGGGGGERYNEGGGDDGGSRRGRRGRGRRGGGGERRERGGGGSGFASDKTFGLALELGEPTGINGKYFLSDSGALDFGVGWIYRHYYYGDGMHIYGDYLWHPVSLASTQSFELPFYIGAGLRFWDFNYCDRNFCYDGNAVGIRVPVGISFDFNNAPLDIFIQLVPVIDFLGGDYYMQYRDREHFGIDLSAGIRYWFM